MLSIFPALLTISVSDAAHAFRCAPRFSGGRGVPGMVGSEVMLFVVGWVGVVLFLADSRLALLQV
jgi:hypothetical protein